MNRFKLDWLILPLLGLLVMLGIWAACSATWAKELPSPLQTWQASRDYIVKPFDFVELLARLRTQILRREGAADPNVITVGRLSLDLTTRQARFASAVARLTQRETELLSALMRTPNRPVSRGDIFDELWATHGGLSLNVVDVYVGYLRTKLGDIARIGGPMIVTVRGRGFMLDLRDPSFNP